MTTQKKKFGIMQWLPVVVPVSDMHARTVLLMSLQGVRLGYLTKDLQAQMMWKSRD